MMEARSKRITAVWTATFEFDEADTPEGYTLDQWVEMNLGELPIEEGSWSITRTEGAPHDGS